MARGGRALTPSATLDATLISGVLLLLRITAFFTSAPLVSARGIPMRVRLGLAVVVTIAAASIAPAVQPPSSLAELVMLALGEACAGLLMGLVPRLVFEVAAAAAQTAGLGAGLGFGATVDPINGAQSTSVGDIALIATSGAALAVGLHRDLIAFICRLSIEHPAGTLASLDELIAFAPGAIVGAIILAARLALVALASTSAAHVALGVVGRAVPQLGLANLGFAAPLFVFGYLALTWLDVVVVQTLGATNNVLSTLGG